MFLYCPNNIDLVIYYNVSYVISYVLEKCGHFIFIENTQHYSSTIYYAKKSTFLVYYTVKYILQFHDTKLNKYQHNK